MSSDTANRQLRNSLQRIVWASLSGTGLALAAPVSYELTARLLTSAISSRDDPLLGGMWSVVATLCVMTASITTTVVLVVAEITPQHAWTQPILRLVLTSIGVGVGVTAVWIGGHPRLRAFRRITKETRQ